MVHFETRDAGGGFSKLIEDRASEAEHGRMRAAERTMLQLVSAPLRSESASGRARGR